VSNDINESVERLAKITNDFRQLEKAGYELQDAGRDVVSLAKLGQECSTFLAKQLPKYQSVADDYPDFAPDVCRVQEWANYTKDQIQVINIGALSAKESAWRSVSTLTTACTSGSACIYATDSNAYGLRSEQPSFDPHKKYFLERPKFHEFAKMQEKLH
jgi:hypothetical protein